MKEFCYATGPSCDHPELPASDPCTRACLHREVLAAVPADKSGYTPDARSKTAFELVWHIASSEMFFLNGAISGAFSGGGERPESMDTPAAVVEWYNGEFSGTLARLKQMSGDDLARVVDFHGMFQVPAVAYVQLMINHSVHHRGQLSAYLRPMGGLVPSIYGGSADEPMSM